MLRGLLNVKLAMRTRLTKKSEKARTAIDDKKDEMEEKEADESRDEGSGYRFEKDLVEISMQRWEEIRDNRVQLADRQHNEASMHDWILDSNPFNEGSALAADLSSSYDSEMESGSRSSQEPESGSSSACSGDDGPDRNTDSHDEAPSDDESSDIVETQIEESVISKILSDAKCKHYPLGKEEALWYLW